MATVTSKMLCVVAAVLVALKAAAAASPPHILWIVADDLGYDDLSLTGMGSNVKTPVLSKLAHEGTVLSNYYVNAICTPTRTSFMSGRYPIHVGLQHGVIEDGVPDALPINQTLVPEYMKMAGYETHAVGKWHLGFHEKKFTPEARGFDSHMGYYTGNCEYWNHTSPCWHCGNYTALDLHYATATSFEPITNASMKYSTELFGDEIIAIVQRHNIEKPLFVYAAFEAVHGASSCYAAGKPPNCNQPDGDELQAPSQYIQEQSHIVDKDRRTFAGMLGALDEAVGNITNALKAKGMLDNTLVFFTTDNGAPDTHMDMATMSNWPLKGGKGQLWEGGVRGTSFVWGPSLGVKGGVNNTELFHACDLLPTFAAVGGLHLSAKILAGLDGFNIWSSIVNGTASPRTEILHNIDPITNASAVRVGEWKLVLDQGNAGWGPNPTDPSPKYLAANPDHQGPWLFNIRNDPSERVNHYNDPQFASNQKTLEAALQKYKNSAVPIRNLDVDPNAQPKPIPGLTICTPSPVDVLDPTKGSQPIMCLPTGVWQPWQKKLK